MNSRTKIVLFSMTVVFSTVFLSCFKSEEYPDEPIISNATASVMGDSAMVMFDFTDGDADIGLAPSDTIGEFAPGSYYYHNIYMDYYEKDDNLGWVPGFDAQGDTIRFAYRVKPVKVSQNTEGIKGRIDIVVSPQYRNITSPESDTVKYEIVLIDRALHVSNKLETPPLIAE